LRLEIREDLFDVTDSDVDVAGSQRDAGEPGRCVTPEMGNT
jgi:hypothetical protein